MFHTVIFDMDGVLIDSQPLHFRVDREVLRQCGVDASIGGVEKHAGERNQDRWSAFKEEYGLRPSVEELIQTHTVILMRLFIDCDLKPMEGVMSFLSHLRQRRIKTAVASSSSQALIDFALRGLRIDTYFDALVTGDDVPNGKPAPDVFLKAAEKLGSEPRDCMVIEDSANGVLAAKNAGMFCAAFNNPNSGRQDLSMADFVFHTFDEILPNLS